MNNDMNLIKFVNTKIVRSFLRYGRLQRSYFGTNFRTMEYGLISSLRRYSLGKGVSMQKLRSISTHSDLSIFSLKSEKLFTDIGEKLEGLCDKGLIQDVDFNDEFINIVFEHKKGKYFEEGGKNIGTIVISRQSSTKQIWYSSPFRKPDYFEFSNGWRSERTKKTLYETLKEDILLLSGFSIDFSVDI
ncbi:hypothetical protein FG386_000226 [Cryptosporidium ryanae]|uniref:uncharacterized protein n=1 Tax=Cryptosporidium ryanae TaxID=515981 RepID=UPI003519DF87|nr:hypothetical protein FG386_000226 [Cryptosporidium ryanae]